VSTESEPVIVAAVGSFDILHLGHVRYLEYARSRGSYLIVVLSSDERVNRRKGFHYHDEQTRRHMLETLRVVDQVVIGDTDDVFQVFDRINFDLLVIGYDELFSESRLRSELDRRGHEKIRIEQAPFFAGGFFKKHRYVAAYLAHQAQIDQAPDQTERL